MTEIPYQVYAADKFFSVIDKFKSNFESNQEHGAQFCAYKNGKLILDLHGGWADKKKSKVINPSTLFSIFSIVGSTSNGIIATASIPSPVNLTLYFFIIFSLIRKFFFCQIFS